MNNDLLEQVLKRVADLERKLERYYYLLHIENELDFILNGTYLSSEDIDNVLTGNY